MEDVGVARVASIGVRVEPALKEAAEMLAESQNRSLAGWVERLMADQLASAGYESVRSEQIDGIWHVLWKPEPGSPVLKMLGTPAMQIADLCDKLDNRRLAAALRASGQAANSGQTFDAP